MPASVAGLKTSARISWQQSRSVADFIFIADHIWCCKCRRTTFARNLVSMRANPHKYWRFRHRRKFAKSYPTSSIAAFTMHLPHNSHTGFTFDSPSLSPPSASSRPGRRVPHSTPSFGVEWEPSEMTFRAGSAYFQLLRRDSDSEYENGCRQFRDVLYPNLPRRAHPHQFLEVVQRDIELLDLPYHHRLVWSRYYRRPGDLQLSTGLQLGAENRTRRLIQNSLDPCSPAITRGVAPRFRPFAGGNNSTTTLRNGPSPKFSTTCTRPAFDSSHSPST